jgi:hypothetical protein
MESKVFRFEAEIRALENASLRRKLAMQRAVLLSVLLHGSLLALFLLFPEAAERPAPVAAGRVIERDPPVPITFLAPLPPEPVAPPVPNPEPDRPFPDIPAPDERYDDVPLRMEPNPARPTASPEAPRADRPAARGLEEARPAGGESGGKRTEPVPGSPGGGAEALPKDLQSRLRDFGRAIGRMTEEPGAGPEGSGSGRGGFSIPDLPSAGFGVGNLRFESRDYDWADYGRAIYVAIWRAWHNRLLITAGVFERWSTQNREPLLDHQSIVRFVIERSGEVSEVFVEGPSGCFPLDESAADALRSVILPPLPPDFPRDRENVRAMFLAHGEIRFLRPNLELLKSRGYF